MVATLGLEPKLYPFKAGPPTIRGQGNMVVPAGIEPANERLKAVCLTPLG